MNLLPTAFAVSCLALVSPPRADAPWKKPLLPPTLRTRVEAAIQRGVSWLLTQQERDGAFRGTYVDTYPLGETALGVLALCGCGRSIDDECVKKAIGVLDARYHAAKQPSPHRKNSDNRRGRAGVTPGMRSLGLRTYDVGLTLMAVVAAYTDHSDPGIGGGDDVSPYAPETARRKMLPIPGKIAEWIQEMADWLVAHRTKIGRDQSSWRYPDGGEDHSNAQYAVLGLRAALDAGARVDGDTLLDALRHFLAEQDVDGAEVRRRVPALPVDGKYAASTSESSQTDRARGWGYSGKGGATVSMTAAGVSTMIICRDACRTKGLLSSELDARAQRSIDDGLAWIGLHFASKEGRINDLVWGNYQLYGIERAGVLAQRQFMGSRDWYADGSSHLVGRQQEAGHWGPAVTETAFALLFLARATDLNSPLRGHETTRPIAANLNLDSAMTLSDREFPAVFAMVFDGWRRGLVPHSSDGEASARPTYTTDDVHKLGSRAIRALVGQLDELDGGVRHEAFQLLFELTGERLGYDPGGPRAQRLDALERWKALAEIESIADAARQRPPGR
ncbi:MAG: terpene cyclase/mutase family protein [Planctomycetes bacterium]|nr:terpene cyclase/mutase family protein [Planctomycetota bacterium]MBI3847150.1 terpene cyclase/mutase family protein [Planctomycetota bacterium]